MTETPITLPGTDAWKAAVESEQPPDGLYAGVPEAVYHGRWDLPSQSRMKTALQRTPAHAKWEQDHPDPQTPSMAKGSALHARVLQPDRFDELVTMGPTKTRYADAWKRMAAEHPHLTLLTQDEMDEVLVMADRVRRHDEVVKMGAAKFAGQRELSVIATLSGIYPAKLDQEQQPFKLQVKARLDWWLPAIGWYGDLKTCADASDEAFNKSVHNYGYHVQGAFYEAALAAHGIETRRIVFVLVENGPPFEPAVKELMPEALDRGRVLAGRMTALWAWCVDHDQYPGYPPNIGEATLPRWALTTQDAWSLWDEELT